MKYTSIYITPDIKLSCYEDRFFKSDILFEHHMLIWFISGETKIVQGDKQHHFMAGDIFLIPRNHLATILNYPGDGLPHKTVVMHLTQDRLKAYYQKRQINEMRSSSPSIRKYTNHALLKSCLSSLIPYFELDSLPESIADLKIEEAISILREIDPATDSLLADFEEPGKIDLVAFMEKNFMYNMPLVKFSYLTGRSLTSFKRDFQKHYQISPQRWLVQKRLELAHYQLKEKKKKPVDVCYEVGFENLSHFSFAFKKRFGYAPSAV